LIGETGSLICGRRTYDDSIRHWGADGPTGSDRVPVVVLTHNPPSDAPEDGVYTFVTSGVEDALDEGRSLAAGKDVAVAAGPDVGNQFLRAGLIDELSIHLVPVLFGDGLP
jgi:dihydrofolate reductase